jgi:hypothetical protein
MAIKNSMVLTQNRHEDQWDRIEDPGMNPYSYTHLIFDKNAKNMWRRKDSLCKQMLLGKPDICLQKTKTRSMFVTLYKYQLNMD